MVERREQSDVSVEHVRAVAISGALEQARALLHSEGFYAATPAVERARLAQELGDVSLARSWLEQHLEEQPDDDEARAELDELLADLGERPTETGTSVDGDDAHATAPGDDGDEVEDPLLAPADADLVRFLHLFSGREDTHARQWYDAQRGQGYAPVRGPLTPALARAHLAGSTTLGMYLLRVDETVTLFCVDLDIRRRVLEAAQGDPVQLEALRRAVHEEGLKQRDALVQMGFDVVLEDSGFKGRHLWVFLERPLPARMIHTLGQRLLGTLRCSHPSLTLEFFPKQPRRSGKGLGNLVKLPLGVHQRTGRRATVLDDEGQVLDDPWPRLRSIRRAPEALVMDVMTRLRDARAPQPAAPDDTGEAQRDAPANPASTEQRAKPEPQELPRLSQAEVRAHPAVQSILDGCAVLDRLVTQAFDERRLSHDERTVIAHSLGHLDDGVQIVNSVLGACPETPLRALMKRPFRGFPISCPRIRARIPHVTATVACHCAFEGFDDYPTPQLHASQAADEGGDA